LKILNKEAGLAGIALRHGQGERAATNPIILLAVCLIKSVSQGIKFSPALEFL